MNKTIKSKLYLLLAGFLIVLASCSSSNDNEYDVSEEWKSFQLDQATKAIDLVDEKTGVKVYKSLKTESGLGYVYHRPSSYITKRMEGDFSQKEPIVFAAKSVAEKEVITSPEYETDIVKYRYEAWYYKLDGERAIFESTEFLNNNYAITRALNTTASGQAFTDGLKSLLMDMTVGEERIGCVRHELAYGMYGGSMATISGSTVTIMGYTTLFYDVRLLEVIRP